MDVEEVRPRYAAEFLGCFSCACVRKVRQCCKYRETFGPALLYADINCERNHEALVAAKCQRVFVI